MTMNKTEMMYKADTGMSAKVGFEIDVLAERPGFIILSNYELKKHFDLSDDILELPSPEYLKWLEEKVEKLNL